MAPERIEHHLVQSSLVDWALAVGNQRPYCGLLIFPNRRRLLRLAKKLGVHLPLNEIVDHAQIVAEYQLLVDAANQKLPAWSRVKRFRLIPEILTVTHGLLTPSRRLDREATCTAFAEEIEALYSAVVPAITQPVSTAMPPTSTSLTLEAS